MKKGLVVVVVLTVTAVVIVVILVTVLLTQKKKSLSENALPNIPGVQIIFDDNTRKKFLSKYGKREEVIQPSIFVAISSYRDPELCVTLRDLIDKALNPKRIFIGVVEQNDPTDAYSSHAKNAGLSEQNIRIKTMHHREAKGPTHARAICEGLFNNENYYLMTDSHMRFEPGWDVDLLDMLFKTRRPQRTIITMYPEGYERKVENGVVKYKYMIRKGWRYEQFKKFNDQGILEFESVTTLSPIPKKPLPVPTYAACFVFGHSDILRLVPFHPGTPYLFFGEEMFMAVRLLSHGFDLVGPTHSVVYHLWVRDYRKTYWDHDIIHQRDTSIKKSFHRLLCDILRIKDIITGRIRDDKYGIGKARSWQEIQEYFGVDFEKRKFTRPHQPWKPPKSLRLINDEFVKK